MGLGNVITPFWKNLHKIFIYPFSAFQPLILIFGLTLLTVLFHREGMFFGLLRFCVWGLMLAYAFEALQHTAQGHFKPPKISIEALLTDFNLVFR